MGWLGKAARLRVFFIAFFALLHTQNAVFADDAMRKPDGNGLVASRIKEVKNLILELSEEDPRKRTDAASQLAAFPFQEVKDSLLNALEKEVKGVRPNSYMMAACIEGLKSMVGRKDRVALVQISGQISRGDQTWTKRILQKMEELIAASEKAPSGLMLAALPQEEAGKPFLDQLLEAATKGQLDPEIYKVIKTGTETDISHDMAVLANDPRNPTIVGREKEAEQVLKIMVRIKSRIPVLVGEAGVGKTAVAQAISLMIKKGNLPEWFVFSEEFPGNTVVIQTSAARIGRLALSNADSSQAAALELYFDAIKTAQKALKMPILIFMDEIHTLSRGQKDALKPYAEQVDGVRILGATTNREFQLMIGSDNAIRRRLTPVPVHELSEEETLDVLKQGWISQIESRYHVSIPDEVLPSLIHIAPEVLPDLARPDSPIKFIQDLAIDASRGQGKKGESAVVITEGRARDFAASITGIPINPRDPKQLLNYVEDGRKKIKERVIGQDHMVDVMVDTWMDVLTSDATRAWRSVGVIGTTGTGKTLTAEKLGEVFLRNREKVLVVDCTAYSSGPHALNSLIGAPNGIISSDETKGILPEFLSGKGKESGVIILNEFDKAHPDLGKKLMEMIDRGELTGGDGHTYRLRRHLVVFTTNRGANKIFNEKLGHLMSSEELLNRVRKITDAQARSFFTQSDGYAYMDEHRLPPEVVNRVDRWVVAKPITFEDALAIAELKAVRFSEENLELHKLHFSIDKDVLEAITRVAFTPADGARPVEKRVESILSRCRAAAWAVLDKVADAKLRIAFYRDEREGTASILVVDQDNNKTIAQLPFDEPTRFMALRDPKFLDTLMTLEAKIKTEIFGQDEAIAQIAAAVRARANRPLDPTPLSVWLLGSTGVGKTESAKVLAKYLYGSPERAQVLSFGKVNHMYELNDIFGPPRGIIGSESKAIFETILESFPEGCVIVMDEISNMGRGATPSEKDSLFKRMYEIFGEGKWTNAHGKTYDLANFTFILTGNDGEQLFEKLPNDDLRGAVWEKYQSRESIKGILRESHIPEAFVNRMDALVLMRPLGGKVRGRVISKFLERVTKQLEEAHGVKIEFADGFEEKISRSFFPLGDGARGTERFTKIELTAFIGDFILANYQAVQAAKDRRLRVDVELNFPDRSWAVEKKVKPKAKLVLQAALSDASGGVTQLSTSKIVDPTSSPRITLTSEAMQTAVHEAGHALVNEQLGLPTGSLRYLTIEAAGNYGGYASYRDEDLKGDNDLLHILRIIAVAGAGTEAQRVAGRESRDAGWKSDRDKINSLAYRAVVEFGLIDGLEFIPPDEKGHPDPSKLDPQARTRLMRVSRSIVKEGMNVARQVLLEGNVRAQTESTVKLLIANGSVTGDEFRVAIGNYRMADSDVDKLLRQAVSNVLMSSEDPDTVVDCGSHVVAEANTQRP